MAGIAIVLDLLRKNPSFTGQAFHSHGVFSAKLAASAAAASVAASYPFASRAFFGNLALTSLRALLSSYLPLLEPRANMEDEDDEDFLQDTNEDRRVDLVTPFKKSVKQIGRETAVVTTRRVLERLAVHYVSQRMAWKLLKDVPKSAARKAQRRMSSVIYFWGVTKTTCRGHFLGVLASWFVQVGIDIWRIFKSKQDGHTAYTLDRSEKIQLLRRKISITTVRCGASLVFASIGAGIGAMIFRPTTGQWIGCAIGDVSGPVIVAFCVDKVLHREL